MENNTRLISAINTIARGLGMSYGSFVNAYGNILPDDSITNANKEPRMCTQCGEELPPEAPGKKCAACIAQERAQRRKTARVYARECTRCGATVHTRQPPRRGMNLYCPSCRKRKRDA